MMCTKERHIFEYAEDHTYNRPEGVTGNCRDFPEGHLCLCNEKVYKRNPIVFPYPENKSITMHLADKGGCGTCKVEYINKNLESLRR